MESLLFLAHRIPYPPNKGDKIRSFNILKHLSRHYRIHLGCFVDDHHDLRYLEELEPYCEEIFHIPLVKLSALIKGTSCFLSGKPLTLPYFHAAKMQRWVSQTTQQNHITKAFVFSSSMAQYLETSETQRLRRVIDFVDVDSNKWLQYAAKKTYLSKWFFKREHRTLFNYETLVTEQFDASLFVSEDETNFFCQQITTSLHHKVHTIRNGVDLDYFTPAADLREPEIRIDPACPTLVFTGAMDYWANEDAVVWFVEQAWPHIKTSLPNCRFYIVGGNPSATVKALQNTLDVTVTGRVEDVRPYLHQATLVVAPLQIARGIQNKVLEAMAMAKPIVATTLAMEGIGNPGAMLSSITDTPEDFAAAVIDLVKHQDQYRQGQKNRAWVEQNFSWEQSLSPLKQLLDRPSDTSPIMT